MAFEKFVPPCRVKPAHVSIKRTGTIAFDIALAATLGLTKAGHALLDYDAGKKLLGVKPTHDPKDEGALRLSHRKSVSSLQARAFFEVYGIQLDRTARYPFTHDEESGMAVVDIGEVKRRRGPRKRNL